MAPASAEEVAPAPDTATSETPAASTADDPPAPPAETAADAPADAPAESDSDASTADAAETAPDTGKDAGSTGADQQSLAAPLIAAAVVCGTAWPVGSSPFPNFEIDGNLCVNTVPLLDWENAGSQPVTNDGYSDSTQWTQGAKEDNWAWSGGQTGGNGTAPDKTDIGNVYAFTQTVAGHVYAYLGFERAKNSGSVSYHVELNQKPNQFGPVPNRTVNDLRLTIEQTGSNTISLIGADKWNGSAWVSLGNLSGFVGQVNQAGTTNLSGAALATGEFAEMAIDLTALFGDTGCSGNYGVLNVRSSSSPEDTSSLADWIAPVNLNVPSTCSTLTILKTDMAGTPLAGAEFTIAPNPATGTGSTTGTSDATGKIVFSGNVQPSKTYTITETKAPVGYLLPADVTEDVTFGATAESKTVTFKDPLGEATWLKHDGDGQLLGGATFQLSATGGAAAAAPWASGFPKTVADNGLNDADPVAGQIKVVNLPTGSYSVTETAAPTGYILNASQTRTFTISQASQAPAISTAFVNIPYATVTLTKDWVNAFTGDKADLSISGAASGTATSTAPVDGPVVTVSVAPGAGLSLAEVLGGANTGTYTSVLTCVGAAVSGNTGLAGSIVVPAYPASKAGVQCTFTNTAVERTITVKKTWIDAVAGDKAVLNAGPTASATNPKTSIATQPNLVDNTNVATVTVRVGDTVTLSETLAGNGNVGSYGTSYSCTDQAQTSGTTLSFALKVPNQNVTCTFTNTGQRATVKLQKNWVGAFKDDEAHLAISGAAADSDLSVASGVDGVDDTFSQVTVNVGQKVTLSESIVDADNTGRYTSTWSCDNGTSGSGRSIPEITVAGSVTCTITNTAKTIDVSVGKIWKDAFANDSANLSINGQGGVAIANGSALQTMPNVVVRTVRVGEPVTVVETLGDNTGTYTTTVDCTGVAENVDGRTATFTAPGGDVVCTYTNEAVKHDVTLVKKWVDALQDDKATISLGGTTDESTASAVSPFTDSANAVTRSIREGDTVALSETLNPANAGTYGSVLTCTPGASFTGSNRSHTLTVPTFDVTCTYTNTADTVTVSLTKHWVDAFAADQAGLKIERGAQTMTAGTSTASDVPDKTISAVVRVGDKVVLSEAFDSQNTGAYSTSWVCTGGATPGANALTTAELTVGAGGISCTVTNTAKKITVTVDKQWAGAFVGDDVTVDVNGTTGGSDAGTTNQLDTNVVVKPVRIGEMVSISETPTAGNTGVYDAEWKCGPEGTYVDGAAVPPFKAAVDITCTFQNTARERTVKLQKQWVDAIQGDTATLSIDGGPGVVSTANGQAGSWVDPLKFATASVRIGEVIDLDEVLDAKSGSMYDSSYSCMPGGVVAPGTGTGTGFEITVTSGAGDIVCTFTNSNSRGQITLLKTVVKNDGGTAADTAWTLNATGIVTASGVEGSPAVTDAFVPVGTYELTETGGPAGYLQTGLECAGGIFTAAAAGKPATVTVAAASHVVCTFTNDDVAPKLTLVKKVVTTGGGVSGATDWTLTATGPTAWTSATSGTAAQATTSTQDVKAGAGYALTENGPAGYTAGSWSCDTAGVLAGSTVTLPLAANVTCEITNTAIPASGTHVKTVDSVSQDSNGVWTIVYKIVVTNTSVASTLTYDLDDSLQFGDGVEVQDASWTGPSDAVPVPFDTEWSTILANDVQLTTAAGTHTYWVTAHATVATFPGAQDTWQDCVLQPGEEGTGFLNSALLTIGRVPAEQTACDEPEFPSVVKSAATPTQDPATGNWTIGYTIDVTTTGSAADGDPAVYTVVEDALPVAPANWSLVGGTWHVTSGAGTPALDVNLAPGERQLFAGSIPAGSHYTYTVTGVLDPSAGAGALGDCDEQGGLVNEATVTSGAASDDDDACVEITPPRVSITKTVTDVDHLVGGLWQVVYDIEVKNSTALTANYSLTDDIEFGGDITVLPASSWSGPTGGGSFALPAGTATLATDYPLVANSSHHYTVTVLAQVELADFAGETIDCQPEGSLEAGGFLNTATVTAAGVPLTADDCAEPALPTITKTAIGALQDSDDASKWRVAYLITVTPNGYDDTYRLDDFPGFPGGVTVGAGTAQRVNGLNQPLAAFPLLNILGNNILPSVAISAGDVHRYLVTWEVDVATFPSTHGECVQAQSDEGFYNSATMTVGGIPLSDDACIPVVQAVYPTLDKTVTSAVQDPETGEWTITYDIVVNLPGNETGENSEYSLEDALDFGDDIEVTDASWEGPGGAPGDAGDFDDSDWTADLATDRQIEDGDTHVYTVTVHANVPQAAIDAGSTSCVEGEAGGFLNTVELTSLGQTITDEDCAEPAFPEIEKHGLPAVQDEEDASWTVSYVVNVDHDGTIQDPAVGAGYVLTDTPAALPDGVELVEGETWHAEADGAGTPDPTDDSWSYGDPEWVIVSGTVEQPGEGADSVHTYRIWTTVQVTDAPDPADVGDCADVPETGIVLFNSATIDFGADPVTDAGCTTVQFDDVGIEKTALLPDDPETGEPLESVDTDTEFDYILEVTNWSTRAATEVRVTDPIHERLEILGVTVGGHTITPEAGFSGNLVDFTIDDALAPGEVVEVTVHVRFLPAPVGEVPEFPAEQPEIPDPLEQIDNEACVVSALDTDDDANHCDDETVFTRDISAAIYATCLSDAPLLGWVLRKSSLVADLPGTLTWVPVPPSPDSDPSEVVITEGEDGEQVGAEWSGVIPWPGAFFTPSGVAVDYPGWRPLTAADHGPNGGFINPEDGLEYTPDEAINGPLAFVFNGLILDPSELDYAWRFNSQVTLSVNPEMTFAVAYPPASPECFVARHSDVQIEKTASVEKTDPGKSFTYDLAVANVSDDSAAAGVVVTDKIPSDIKITDITWEGEGDSNVYPNWTMCDVTGEDAGGFGGLLTCELFGELQPAGANEAPSSAPTIRLAATVAANSTSSVITNLGVVDYHTFGDPDDTGRDADDAVVTLSSLPVTGGAPMWTLAAMGLLALLGGTLALVVMRRRRGEAKAKL
ncbi:SpaA isopeptide-forming pilin-related protein [Microbacterium sp. SS28]|uniref:SpaA isopeptide-forming pilin-related protein n=1 Tax=Microbacterium sp. SS28 TaxID=2919948 RepID=UPI001FAA2600|nr:SpaA isopeptide-forming pilin-related protein [Microbacterium sp. SS28]